MGQFSAPEMCKAGSECQASTVIPTSCAQDLCGRAANSGQITCFDPDDDNGDQSSIWCWNISRDNDTDGSLIPVPEDKPIIMRSRLLSLHFCYTFEDHYHLIRLLGEGTFGKVYAAVALPFMASVRENTTMPCREVAVKVVSLDKRNSGRCVGSLKRSTFDVEHSMLARLDHPNIVKMYECFQERASLCLVLEMCHGGELFMQIIQVVEETGHGVHESRSRKLCRQMVSVITYLHANNVIHRDIKSENFLLLGKEGTEYQDIIKLCDFGTAIRLSFERPRPPERAGTWSYTAPELFEGLGASTGADMWSLGVVIYVMLVGQHPFQQDGTEPSSQVVQRIRAYDYFQDNMVWPVLSNHVQNLIERCLVPEKVRISAKDALSEPWFSGTKSTAIPPDRSFAVCAPLVVSAIERFSQLEALPRLIIAACAHVADERSMAAWQPSVLWREFYTEMDIDGDGRLSISEFVTSMKPLLFNSSEITEEYLEELAMILDVDYSGWIEWSEWSIVVLMLCDEISQEVVPEPLGTAFRLIDRSSGDRIIGKNDLFTVLRTEVEQLYDCELQDVLSLLNALG